MSNQQDIQERAYWRMRLFDKWRMQQVRLAKIEQMLGPTLGMTCLVVGGDAAVHVYLGRRGGTWFSADWSEEGIESLKAMLGSQRLEEKGRPGLRLGDAAALDSVKLLKGEVLPYEDNSFDRIVVLDGMEAMTADAGFIEECHRVLKERGCVVFHVSHYKKAGWLRPLSRWLGIDEQQANWVRPGYTKRELFELVRAGFDVELVRDYSHFLMESSELLVQYIGSFIWGRGEDPEDSDGISVEAYQRAYRFFAIVYPCMWFMDLLDKLLFFTRGYWLVVRVKRRIWRGRVFLGPLRDGRSLAEATLGSKIGTAAEF
jgi:SAM-dependent methyltransferase